MAMTSKTSGDWKLGQRLRWFGIGKDPVEHPDPAQWMSGKSPAIMTAKTVMASALRAIGGAPGARNR